MFYDILDKMSGIDYFRISSSELTYTVAIDFKLVSLFSKICHPYHFSYFLESLFLLILISLTVLGLCCGKQPL